MILFLIKALLLSSLFLIFVQDTLERKVYWFLFPIVALLFGLIQYERIGVYQFVINSIINLVFVLIITGSLFLYAKYKMEQPFFETFGLGDFLLFFALSFSFASGTFLILLVFSFMFCIILFLLGFQQKTHKTVPLAGNISFFFGVVFLMSWIGWYDNLYNL